MRRRTAVGFPVACSTRQLSATIDVMPLTEQQERFCHEYITDLNGTQAVIRAGYSRRTASSQADRLLGNAEVRQRVEQLKRERAARTEVSADRVLLELARIAYFDARTLFSPDGSVRPPSEWDDAAAATVAGVDVEHVEVGRGRNRRRVWRITKHRRFDKNKALELLCRHLGMLRDRLSVETPQMPDLSKLTDEQRSGLLGLLRPLFAPPTMGRPGA